jgi:hypothetical protein
LSYGGGAFEALGRSADLVVRELPHA